MLFVPLAQAEESVLAPRAENSLLLDIAVAGKRLVAVGERGHILLSDDDGLRWRQVVAPTQATLTAVWFHDAHRGWAGGHDAVVLRTDDAGEHWKIVHQDEGGAPILDLRFLDGERGLAVGAYGLQLVSEDSGAHWSPRVFRPERAGRGIPASEATADHHLHQLAQDGDGRLFLAAEAGRVFRSDDSGVRWDELDAPWEGTLFGLIALPEGVVLAMGLRGRLFRSGDGGNSWSMLDSGVQSSLYGGLRLSDGRVLVYGAADTLLVSRDGGRRFEMLPATTRLAITSASEIPGMTLVTVGEGGARLRHLAERR